MANLGTPKAPPKTPEARRRKAAPPPARRDPFVETKRIALVVVVLVADLFFSGIVFGWAPLLLVLLDEQQYGELCRADERDVPLTEPCVAQENRLNLMFALAAVATNASSLPAGVFLDRYGPKATTALAGAAQVTALLLMAVADSQHFDVFVPAYVMLAIGGTMTMMASYPVSFLILPHQTAILAAISCLFDGSSVIFLVLYSIRSVFRASRFVLFASYAGFAFVVYALMVALWHVNERALFKRQNSMNEEDAGSETQSLLSERPDFSRSSPMSEKAAKQLLKSHYVDYGTLNEAQLASDHEVDEIHELYRTGMIEAKTTEMDIHEQLRTFEFAYVMMYASVHVLRASVFIGTANKLLINYGDSAKNFLYTKIFSIVLPLGFIFVPAIEFLVERPRGLTLSLIFTNALGLVYNILVLIPVLPVQSATFVLFTGFRAFLYAVLSAFTAKTFGLKHMGTLMGIIFSCGSIVSLLEYPAVYISNLQADGDLTVVYWLSLVACLALFPLTEFHRRREAKREYTHAELLSRFGSPELPREDEATVAGLSYRRSPPLSSPMLASGTGISPLNPKKVRSKSMQPHDRTRSEGWMRP